MEVERKLNVIQKLIDIYVNGKEAEILGDQARIAIRKALNDLTSETMRTYPEWFKEVHEWKSIV